MSDVSAQLRRAVIDRAGNRCEYCRLSQEGQEAAFHIDHVVPRVDGGPTELDNLALACVSCSLRKGPRRTAEDPESGIIVSLYSPRRDRWIEHFGWDGLTVTGKTATGRATAELLQMNRPVIIDIRLEESIRGRHPPDDSVEGQSPPS